MPILKKLQVFAAKVEGTIGTAETLTASEGVYNAYDIKIDGDIEVQMRESPAAFGKRKGTAGARGGKMTFKTDLAWLGSGLPAWASVLFPACGYVESSQVFTPRSEAPGTNVKTVTLGVFDGRKKSLAGAMGNFKIVFPSGQLAYIEWEFTGVWQAPTDTTIITPSHPDDIAARFASSTVTYDSVAQCVENVTFDAGNEVVLRECPDTAAGFKSALIVDRSPKLTLNPEAQLVATDDRFGDWIAGTEAAFSLNVTGKADSDFTLAAPKAQIMSVKDADRNGFLVDEVEMHCNKNGTTNDEDVSLTFTDET